MLSKTKLLSCGANNNILFFSLLSYFNIKYASFFFLKNTLASNKDSPVNYLNFREIKKINYFFLDKNNFKGLLNENLFNDLAYKNWNNFYFYKNFVNSGLDYLLVSIFKNKLNSKFLKKFKLKKVKLKRLSLKKQNQVCFFWVSFFIWPICYIKRIFLYKTPKTMASVWLRTTPITYFITYTPIFLKTKFKNYTTVRLSIKEWFFKNFYFFKKAFYFFKKALLVPKINDIKGLSNFYNNDFVWFYFLNFLSTRIHKTLFKNYNFINVKYSALNFYYFNLLNNTKTVNSLFYRIFENKVPDYFYFLNYFLKNFFELFFKQKIQFNFFFFKNILQKLKKKEFFKLVYFKLKKFQASIGKGFFLEETLEAVWLTFLLKDSSFFLNWLAKTMKRIYFKHHKKFLNFLKLIFSKIFSKIFWLFNCSGFYFLIKGKIGVTGNAKKRRLSFSNKTYSLTTKKNKISFYKTSITTHTGALGVKFLIVFS